VSLGDLAIVNACGVGQNEFSQLRFFITHSANSRIIDKERALLRVDSRHDANLAVEHLLVVVVPDLHDLVANPVCHTEGTQFSEAGRGERFLQSGVEKRRWKALGSYSGAVHLVVAVENKAMPS